MPYVVQGVLVFEYEVYDFWGDGYKTAEDGFEFCVWIRDRNKAVEIVEEIIAKIKSEYDDLKHFVTWQTNSIDVLEVNERYGFVLI